MSTCQICEREIKANTGVIAHHGYKRPRRYSGRGSGWQTASCIGARHAPYEQSRDRLPVAMDIVNRYIARQHGYLDQIERRAISLPDTRHTGFAKTETVMLEPGCPRYDIRRTFMMSTVKYDIESSTRDLARLQKRYDEWQPSV